MRCHSCCIAQCNARYDETEPAHFDQHLIQDPSSPPHQAISSLGSVVRNAGVAQVDALHRTATLQQLGDRLDLHKKRQASAENNDIQAGRLSSTSDAQPAGFSTGVNRSYRSPKQRQQLHPSRLGNITKTP